MKNFNLGKAGRERGEVGKGAAEIALSVFSSRPVEAEREEWLRKKGATAQVEMVVEKDRGDRLGCFLDISVQAFLLRTSQEELGERGREKRILRVWKLGTSSYPLAG